MRKTPAPVDVAPDEPRRIEYLPLSSLLGAERNPKRHAADLPELLKRFGLGAAPELDERTGRLVAGHGRVAALRALKDGGFPAPRGVQVARPDGGTAERSEWLVPVQRGWASVSDADAEAYLLAANTASERGGWDEAELAEMVADLIEEGGGHALDFVLDDARVAELLGDDTLTALEPEAPAPSATAASAEDDEPTPDELAEPVFVQPGELWRMGEHRLLVGDSTKPENVDRLLGGQLVACVVTDPPYAIFGSSNGISADVADDRMVGPFFESVLRTCERVVEKFGHVYLSCDWRSWSSVWEGARRAGVTPKNMLVWDKGGGLGSAYMNAHELIFFGAKLPAQKSAWLGRETGQRMIHGVSNVLRFPRPTGDERVHHASKPVALFATLIEKSTDEGALVLDLFSGGGTTIAACEKTARRARVMEIDPKNAQIAIRRWERITGRQAECIEGAKP